jgi:hypothetical protein
LTGTARAGQQRREWRTCATKLSLVVRKLGPAGLVGEGAAEASIIEVGRRHLGALVVVQVWDLVRPVFVCCLRDCLDRCWNFVLNGKLPAQVGAVCAHPDEEGLLGFFLPISADDRIGLTICDSNGERRGVSHPVVHCDIQALDGDIAHLGRTSKPQSFPILDILLQFSNTIHHAVHAH